MLLPLTLPRYIVLQAAEATGIATGGLLALVWLLQSLRFLDYLVNKGLGVGVFLEITSLLIPRLLTIILPLAVLAGIIFTCRRLQDDQETTALLASGAHPRLAAWPLLGWAALMGGALLLLMLQILPASITAFKDMQADLRARQGQLLLEEGTFNPLGDDLMVYVKRRLSPTSFEQLLVHDTRDPRTPVTWYAREGRLNVPEEGGVPQLLLLQGIRQEAGPRQTSMLEFASYNLDLATQLATPTLGNRSPEVEEQGLAATWAEASNPATSPKRAARLKAEFVHRLSWPMLPIPLALIGMAALLHPPKRKQSSIRGVVQAALAGVLCIGGQFGWLAQAQGGAGWALYMMGLWPWVWVAISLVWFSKASRT